MFLSGDSTHRRTVLKAWSMAIWDLTEEWDTDLRSGDPLGFPGYADKVTAMDHESVRTGLGDRCVVVIGDFDVLGGSMGVVHGEKVVRAVERAVERRLPLVVVTRSGGARMQEGMVSLIQMGRTTAAMNRHARAGLLSIGVFLHPTTGGVYVSYGSRTDLHAAQAGATVGFAGPRVAQTVTGVSVEGHSHTAETAYAAGHVDLIGDLDALDTWVRSALGHLDHPLVLPDRSTSTRRALDPDDLCGPSTAWAEVCAARDPRRPTGIDLVAAVVDSWTELHGTDPTLRAGLATVATYRVVVIAQDRHVSTGRTGPAGFRLARRAIDLASRLGHPIVTLIDTPGAEPGSEAELDGIGEEIAATFAALLDAPVPTVGVCVGEGGSGGALALGVTDVLAIQEHAVFSVIGPEGAASILHRDAGRAPQVAEYLRLTSQDLADLGIVDTVVPEGAAALRGAILDALATVEVGSRTTRMDRASTRWLVERP